MPMANPIFDGGFQKPVFQAQSVFKALMEGMARPGTIATLQPGAAPPSAMGAGAGAIGLTLCDHDTAVHLSMPLVESGVPGWLAFQTGALVTDDRTEAQFSFLDRKTMLPPLSTFSVGTQDYPDRSATIIVEVASLSGGPEFLLSGPGIKDPMPFAPIGLPTSFSSLWHENNALYPRGVDLVLVADLDMLCLPRTTRIAKRGN